MKSDGIADTIRLASSDFFVSVVVLGWEKRALMGMRKEMIYF